jgi:hypothetical protein
MDSIMRWIEWRRLNSFLFFRGGLTLKLEDEQDANKCGRTRSDGSHLADWINATTKVKYKTKTTVLAAPFSIRRNGRLINKFDRACRGIECTGRLS